MKKSAAILGLVILLLITAFPVMASWSWCSNDPEVILPNGQGSVYVWVGVPEAYAGQPVTVHLMVPKGSLVINHPGEANIQVVTHTLAGDAQTIVAKVDEGFPIRLSVVFHEKDLRVFTFERGKGVASWPLVSHKTK